MILCAAHGGGLLFVYPRRRNTLTVMSSYLCPLLFWISYPVAPKGNIYPTGNNLTCDPSVLCPPFSWPFLFPDVNPVCACFVLHSWAGCGQSHGAEVCWWSLWWKHQAHSVPLPHSEDAADSTWKRHHRRVHQKWGFQVSFNPPRD